MEEAVREGETNVQSVQLPIDQPTMEMTTAQRTSWVKRPPFSRMHVGNPWIRAIPPMIIFKAIDCQTVKLLKKCAAFKAEEPSLTQRTVVFYSPRLSRCFERGKQISDMHLDVDSLDSLLLQKNSTIKIFAHGTCQP
jgi:hypothetical protein